MIFLILPAYNEGRGLNRLLAAIHQSLSMAALEYRLIIVDDGSDDLTSHHIEHFAATHSVLSIKHKFNRGLGETIRDGIELAVEMGEPGDIIIRMDADETHNPQYIHQMITEINKGADVVIASRFKRGGSESGVPFIRRILSRGANLFLKILFPIPGITDYACGFRAYRYEVLHTALMIFGNDFIELKGLGFTGTVEKLIKISRLGFSIHEIPLQLNYHLKLSESKMSVRITAIGYLILALKQIYPWGPREKQYRARIASFKKERVNLREKS